MKSIFGALISILCSGAAFASGKVYDVKAELSMNGKMVSSPRFLVAEGTKASVTEQSDARTTFIDLTATESTSKTSPGITMDFVVGFEAKDGTRTILSRPKILAAERERAVIMVKDEQGEEISLAVIAQTRP